ncbi:MAG: hypothetical protein RAP41_07015, partial [Candidatus Orphnella occulta]|nr:hypothetical protein [Candidatus Orphnella occulta]
MREILEMLKAKNSYGIIYYPYDLSAEGRKADKLTKTNKLKAVTFRALQNWRMNNDKIFKAGIKVEGLSLENGRPIFKKNNITDRIDPSSMVILYIIKDNGEKVFLDEDNYNNKEFKGKTAHIAAIDFNERAAKEYAKLTGEITPEFSGTGPAAIIWRWGKAPIELTKEQLGKLRPYLKSNGYVRDNDFKVKYNIYGTPIDSFKVDGVKIGSEKVSGIIQFNLSGTQYLDELYMAENQYLRESFLEHQPPYSSAFPFVTVNERKDSGVTVDARMAENYGAIDTARVLREQNTELENSVFLFKDWWLNEKAQQYGYTRIDLLKSDRQKELVEDAFVTIRDGRTYKGTDIYASYNEKDLNLKNGKYAPKASAIPVELFANREGEVVYFKNVTLENGTITLAREDRFATIAERAGQLIGISYELKRSGNNFTEYQKPKEHILGYTIGDKRSYNGMRLAASYRKADVNVKNGVYTPKSYATALELFTVYRGKSVYFKDNEKYGLVREDRIKNFAERKGDTTGITYRLIHKGNNYTDYENLEISEVGRSIGDRASYEVSEEKGSVRISKSYAKEDLIRNQDGTFTPKPLAQPVEITAVDEGQTIYFEVLSLGDLTTTLALQERRDIVAFVEDGPFKIMGVNRELKKTETKDGPVFKKTGKILGYTLSGKKLYAESDKKLPIRVNEAYRADEVEIIDGKIVGLINLGISHVRMFVRYKNELLFFRAKEDKDGNIILVRVKNERIKPDKEGQLVATTFALKSSRDNLMFTEYEKPEEHKLYLTIGARKWIFRDGKSGQRILPAAVYHIADLVPFEDRITRKILYRPRTDDIIPTEIFIMRSNGITEYIKGDKDSRGNPIFNLENRLSMIPDKKGEVIGIRKALYQAPFDYLDQFGKIIKYLLVPQKSSTEETAIEGVESKELITGYTIGTDWKYNGLPVAASYEAKYLDVTLDPDTGKLIAVLKDEYKDIKPAEIFTVYNNKKINLEIAKDGKGLYRRLLFGYVGVPANALAGYTYKLYQDPENSRNYLEPEKGKEDIVWFLRSAGTSYRGGALFEIYQGRPNIVEMSEQDRPKDKYGRQYQVLNMAQKSANHIIDRFVFDGFMTYNFELTAGKIKRVDRTGKEVLKKELFDKVGKINNARLQELCRIYPMSRVYDLKHPKDKNGSDRLDENKLVDVVDASGGLIEIGYSLFSGKFLKIDGAIIPIVDHYNGSFDNHKAGMMPIESSATAVIDGKKVICKLWQKRAGYSIEVVTGDISKPGNIVSTTYDADIKGHIMSIGNISGFSIASKVPAEIKELLPVDNREYWVRTYDFESIDEILGDDLINKIKEDVKKAVTIDMKRKALATIIDLKESRDKFIETNASKEVDSLGRIWIEREFKGGITLDHKCRVAIKRYKARSVSKDAQSERLLVVHKDGNKYHILWDVFFGETKRIKDMKDPDISNLFEKFLKISEPYGEFRDPQYDITLDTFLRRADKFTYHQTEPYFLDSSSKNKFLPPTSNKHILEDQILAIVESTDYYEPGDVFGRSIITKTGNSVTFPDRWIIDKEVGKKHSVHSYKMDMLRNILFEYTTVDLAGHPIWDATNTEQSLFGSIDEKYFKKYDLRKHKKAGLILSLIKTELNIDKDTPIDIVKEVPWRAIKTDQGVVYERPKKDEEVPTLILPLPGDPLGRDFMRILPFEKRDLGWHPVLINKWWDDGKFLNKKGEIATVEEIAKGTAVKVPFGVLPGRVIIHREYYRFRPEERYYAGEEAVKGVEFSVENSKGQQVKRKFFALDDVALFKDIIKHPEKYVGEGEHIVKVTTANSKDIVYKYFVRDGELLKEEFLTKEGKLAINNYAIQLF